MSEVETLLAASDSWKWQLRDRLGKWVEMGSKVKWLANGLARTGVVVDSPRESIATVEEDHTKRRIDIPANRLTVVDAPANATRQDGPDLKSIPVTMPVDAPKPVPSKPKAAAKAVVTGPENIPDYNKGTAPKASNEADQGLFDKVWSAIKNFRQPDGTRRKGREDGTGTEDDPVFVGRDVNKAVELLLAGKHIRMNDEREVAVVAQKVGPLIKQRRGEVLKKYDLPEDTKIGSLPKDSPARAELETLAVNLCQVHVPKTNLFCVEHKGITRVNMPQLSGKDKDGKDINVQPQAEEMLSSMGLISEVKTVPVNELKASQSELGGEQVAGMIEAAKSGKLPMSVLQAPILVTKDGYIIDGHHRWATLMALDLEDGKVGDMTMQVKEVDMEIGEALATVNAFADAAGVMRKAAAGKADDLGDLPEILKNSKVRKSVLDWLQKQLQPLAASAVGVGDFVLVGGEIQEVLGVVARTSAGRSLMTRTAAGPNLLILRDDEQVISVTPL